MLDRRLFLLAAASAPALVQEASAQTGLPPVPKATPQPEGPLVTPALAKLASETRYKDLPAPVVAACKRFLLDTLGCALAGHRLEKPKAPIALAKASGGADARVLGTGEIASPGAAAFANGELISALDYDCLPHSAPYVAAPLLAIAEQTGARGEDLIAALAVGLDIASRINRNVSTMGASVAKTGLTPDVFGNSNEAIIGGAAAIANLLRFDATKTAHAMGLAAYYCAVPYSHDWELRSPKSMVKYGPVGPSCQNAISAAFLAGQGYTGDPLVLDGPSGFPVFYERHGWDNASVLADLGSDWSVVRSQFKPYAACRFVHTQIDAMIALCKRARITAKQVSSVHSQCFPFVGNLEMMNVRTQEDAQFSIPYVLALALHGVPLDAYAYDWTKINDPAIRATMRKISWEWHPDSLTTRAKTPNSYLCQIEVKAGGKTYTQSAVTPSSVQSDADLAAKFLANARVCLSAARADRGLQMIMALERVENVRAVMDTLVV